DRPRRPLRRGRAHHPGQRTLLLPGPQPATGGRAGRTATARRRVRNARKGPWKAGRPVNGASGVSDPDLPRHLAARRGGAAAQLGGNAEAVFTGVSVASVVVAWAVVHTVFALRYGDLYYRIPVGGLDFHDEREPTYRDFAYVAFTVGMTYQVSDTEVTSSSI